MKPPMIENTPIRLVTVALVNRMISISDIPWVDNGRRCRSPIIQRRTSGRTRAITTTKNNASASNLAREVQGLNCEAINEVTPPRISQPHTSSIAAAPMVSVATRERDRPSSMNIRPRMGSAVIDSAVAKNNWKASSEGLSPLICCQKYSAVSMPLANGTSSPPMLMTMTERLRPLRCVPNSNSRPTWNISRIRPICAVTTKAVAVCGTNSAASCSGKKYPSRLGPSTSPARISPATGVWPRLRVLNQAISRETLKITMSCSRNIRVRCSAWEPTADWAWGAGVSCTVLA
ncbi:hypothetical protein D3C79_702050 [compost metagenome]